MRARYMVGLAVFAAAAVLVFLTIHHYRPAKEIAERNPAVPARSACADCHSGIVAVTRMGPHATLGCETCHGALSQHVQDCSRKPALPDTAKLCAGCHEADSAKPKAFPQVVSQEHSKGAACGACHNAHQPKV